MDAVLGQAEAVRAAGLGCVALERAVVAIEAGSEENKEVGKGVRVWRWKALARTEIPFEVEMGQRRRRRTVWIQGEELFQNWIETGTSRQSGHIGLIAVVG
jgi:hypothetical protein